MSVTTMSPYVHFTFWNVADEDLFIHVLCSRRVTLIEAIYTPMIVHMQEKMLLRSEFKEKLNQQIILA